MNGIGLAVTLPNLRKLLASFKELLRANGQILFDSSDVAYLYAGNEFPQNYYGEIAYNYYYKGEYSGWFTCLYIDKKTMEQSALEAGFIMHVLFEVEDGQYLAMLTR